MQKTKIEYLDYTWNPIAMRCTPVSIGCANCWHLAMAKRLAGNKMIDRDAQRAYMGIDGPSMNYVELEAPLRLRKPSRIGVQFMGDLFHENVTFETIKQVFMHAANCKRHIYLFLTKRPLRMEETIRWFLQFAYQGEDGYITLPGLPNNFWLGVSVEDQKTYDERASILSRIECSHRFISVEPMLGPIVLELLDWRCDWVICGGETGSGARPMELEWARSIVNQCHASGVPVFVKQLTINGKISKKMEEWPEDLRAREVPDGRQ